MFTVRDVPSNATEPFGAINLTRFGSILKVNLPYSKHLMFEDNGNKQQQLEHQRLLDQLYGSENIVDLQHRENGRVLLLCWKKVL